MNRTIAAALAATIVLGFEGPAFAQPSFVPAGFNVGPAQIAANVIFDAAVPAAPARLPMYRLLAGAAPSAFVAESLARSGDAPLGMHGTRALATTSGGSARAFADLVTGDAEVFPDLTQSRGATPTLATRVAAAAFARPDVLARDATTYRLSAPAALMVALADKPARGKHALATTPARTAMTYVTARRFAGGLPVYGTGSGATIGVADDGRIHAFVHRWKTAVPNGSVAATSDATDVKAEIARELRAFAPSHSTAEVRDIGLVYYDGHARYLQPAYQYRAVVHEVAGKRKIDQPVLGYVPFGRLNEALPTLGARAHGAVPSPERRGVTASATRVRPLDNGGQITLNEYVVQNADGGFVDESNAFYSGLTANTNAFVRSQYYWAYDWEYVGGSSTWYANSANILYTAAHGNVGIFASNMDPVDVIGVNQIGTSGNPGFGAAAGGALAHWIIAACDTVASMYDYSIMTGNPQDAFNNWWGVFQGLHDTLGYRTESWINGGNEEPFGEGAAAGGDVTAAWFNAIASDSAYTDGATYYEGNIGQNVQYGRGSAMVDANFLGGSIYNISPGAPASQLYNFWFNN